MTAPEPDLPLVGSASKIGLLSLKTGQPCTSFVAHATDVASLTRSSALRRARPCTGDGSTPTSADLSSDYHKT